MSHTRSLGVALCLVAASLISIPALGYNSKAAAKLNRVERHAKTLIDLAHHGKLHSGGRLLTLGSAAVLFGKRFERQIGLGLLHGSSGQTSLVVLRSKKSGGQGFLLRGSLGWLSIKPRKTSVYEAIPAKEQVTQHDGYVLSGITSVLEPLGLSWLGALGITSAEAHVPGYRGTPSEISSVYGGVGLGVGVGFSQQGSQSNEVTHARVFQSRGLKHAHATKRLARRARQMFDSLARDSAYSSQWQRDFRRAKQLADSAAKHLKKAEGSLSPADRDTFRAALNMQDPLPENEQYDDPEL